jgi:hypothetical protein
LIEDRTASGRLDAVRAELEVLVAQRRCRQLTDGERERYVALAAEERRLLEHRRHRHE